MIRIYIISLLLSLCGFAYGEDCKFASGFNLIAVEQAKIMVLGNVIEKRGKFEFENVEKIFKGNPQGIKIQDISKSLTSNEKIF